MRILLLRVRMHPQFHFTHQQLSQYTALQSRLILASMSSEFTIWHEAFLQSLKVTLKLWREFFRDPSQCGDHRSEKASEQQTCQSSHVNGAIPLVVVNLFSLCGLLLSFPRLNWAEFLFIAPPITFRANGRPLLSHRLCQCL
jgi:hypothetical protein